MDNNEKYIIFMIGIVLVTIILSIVLAIRSTYDYDYKMAQLGYTQQTLPGTRSVYWVKP